jgi:hypothetical protein
VGAAGLVTERAWATKVHLEQTRIIAAAKAAAGRTVVRALRILPPGAVPVPGPPDVAPAAPAAPTGPARTRETACEGYYGRGGRRFPQV